MRNVGTLNSTLDPLSFTRTSMISSNSLRQSRILSILFLFQIQHAHYLIKRRSFSMKPHIIEGKQKDKIGQGQKVVVIGAGFGGLAAAIRLQSSGYSVTLVEARAYPGGRAAQLCADGFTFDMGPTLITAPHLLE